MNTNIDNVKVKQERILALDGLRGIAALFVVMSHVFDILFIGILGKLGVGIFFVLSGYLMSHLHINLPINALNLKKYAINRFSRIAPIYWIVIIFSIVAYHFDKTFVNHIDGTIQILRHFLFAGSAGVFWSISPEIQFYIFFAGLWISLQSFMSGKRIYFIFFLLVILFFVLTRGFWPGIALPSKIHLFILGVGAGYITTKIEKKWKPIWWTMLELTTVLLIVLRVNQITSAEIFYHDLYIAFLIFILVLLVSIGQGIFSKLLELRVFTFMGKVSFSIYLVHTIVIFYFEKFNICGYCPGSQVSNAMAVLVAIFIAGILSIYIELPLSARVRQLLNKRFL